MLSMLFGGKQESGWNVLKPFQAKYPRYNSVCIGTSIWIASNHENSGHMGYPGISYGMVEYCCTTNIAKRVVPYPRNFKPQGHSMCKTSNNLIVLVDGLNGAMVTFNATTKLFLKPVTFPKLGVGCSCIAVDDSVHIFHMHGRNNSKNLYIIYSLQTRNVNVLEDASCKSGAMVYMSEKCKNPAEPGVVESDSKSIEFPDICIRKMYQDLESKVEALQKANTNLIEKMEALEQQHLDKVQELQNESDELKVENQRLNEENAVYQEEQKEAEIKIADLEMEVKELKMKALDITEYMEWDGETVLFWIMSLEGGRFKPYEKVLRHNLNEEKVNGAHLKDVEAEDVKGWGVKPFDDKKALIRHIRSLVGQQAHVHDVTAMAAVDSVMTAKAIEGAPTMFI